MSHNILPTKKRLHHMNMPNITNPLCDLYNWKNPDTLHHTLLQCPNNSSPGTFLQYDQILFSNFDIQHNMKLPVIHIFSSILFQTCSCRKARRPCTMPSICANLEAGVQILRKKRHQKASEKIEEILVSV